MNFKETKHLSISGTLSLLKSLGGYPTLGPWKELRWADSWSKDILYDVTLASDTEAKSYDFLSSLAQSLLNYTPISHGLILSFLTDLVEARGVREGAVVDTMLRSWSVFPQKAHRSNNNEWWETKKKCHQVFLLLKEFRLSTWWILFDKRIKRHVVSRGSNWGCHGLHNRHGASPPYILSPGSFLFCLFHVLKWKTGMGNATQIFLLN